MLFKQSFIPAGNRSPELLRHVIWLYGMFLHVSHTIIAFSPEAGGIFSFNQKRRAKRRLKGPGLYPRVFLFYLAVHPFRPSVTFMANLMTRAIQYCQDITFD